MTPRHLLRARPATPRDVARWFDDHVRAGINFHPDTRADQYYGPDGRTFTDEQATTYDDLMDKAFTVCEAAGVDIYGLALDALNELPQDDPRRTPLPAGEVCNGVVDVRDGPYGEPIPWQRCTLTAGHSGDCQQQPTPERVCWCGGRDGEHNDDAHAQEGRW